MFGKEENEGETAGCFHSLPSIFAITRKIGERQLAFFNYTLIYLKTIPGI